MKTYLPQINWHDRDQISSCHFNPKKQAEFVTCGASPSIRLWLLNPNEPGNLVTFTSEYTIQLPWINCVRFSPDGECIASSSDGCQYRLRCFKQSMFPHLDATICIVRRTQQTNEETNAWKRIKTLRGHLQPVVDFAWTMDGTCIVSGSMDHIVMVWNVEKEQRMALFSDAIGGILGVCCDPLNEFFCSQSTDRFLRVYKCSDMKIKEKVCKVPPFKIPDVKTPKNFIYIFQGNDVASLNRRLCFTPDGQFLIATSSSLESIANFPSDHRLSRSAAVFHRSDFSKPVAFLPVDPTESSKGAAAYPLLLKTRTTSVHANECTGFAKDFNLPYRLVVAIITGISVIIFDSHQAIPLSYMSGAHYGDLSDVQWSPDGSMLAISSLDGFMTIASFEPNEFGEVYEP